MFDWVLIHAIIRERGEGEQHLDLFGVGVVDQFASEILFHILVLAIVVPGDGKLLRTERPGHPKQQRVSALLNTIHGLFPGGQPMVGIRMKVM